MEGLGVGLQIANRVAQEEGALVLDVMHFFVHLQHLGQRHVGLERAAVQRLHLAHKLLKRLQLWPQARFLQRLNASLERPAHIVEIRRVQCRYTSVGRRSGAEPPRAAADLQDLALV